MTKPFSIPKRQVKQAWELVKANKGAGGIDGESISDFEKDLKGNLYKLWNRMSSGTYFPQPVKAVEIPKKAGGSRILGVPTIEDRVAQMVVRLTFEAQVEPHFMPDSYGYRPGKSALDAVGITRKRCWHYDWVVEFDIKGLFDNIPHDLLLKAVYKHTTNKWVRLYIERWLTTPILMPNQSLSPRTKGTPQGSVISPVLSNLFLHYVFDKWLSVNYPETPWCRYADDGLVHCRTKEEAEHTLKALEQRFRECGLELHPEKTKIVYCKDGSRKDNHENISFTFLGYTFRRRFVKNRRRNSIFVSFTPAASKQALKAMRFRIRKLRVRMWTDLSIAQIASALNPIIQGWIGYFGKFRRSELYGICRHINKTLVRWARRKYKSLRHHKTKASLFVEQISINNPRLFAHWSIGMVGGFS